MYKSTWRLSVIHHMQEQTSGVGAASGVLCNVSRQTTRELEVDYLVTRPAPSHREISYLNSSFLTLWFKLSWILHGLEGTTRNCWKPYSARTRLPDGFWTPVLSRGHGKSTGWCSTCRGPLATLEIPGTTKFKWVDPNHMREGRQCLLHLTCWINNIDFLNWEKKQINTFKENS